MTTKEQYTCAWCNKTETVPISGDDPESFLNMIFYFGIWIHKKPCLHDYLVKKGEEQQTKVASDIARLRP